MADDVLVIPDTNSARHSRPTVPDFGTDYVEQGLELTADFDAGLLSVSDGAALHSFDGDLYYARDIGRRTGERQLTIPGGTSALYYDFDAKGFAFSNPGEPALQVGSVDADAETVTDVSRSRSEDFESLNADHQQIGDADQVSGGPVGDSGDWIPISTVDIQDDFSTTSTTYENVLNNVSGQCTSVPVDRANEITNVEALGLSVNAELYGAASTVFLRVGDFNSPVPETEITDDGNGPIAEVTIDDPINRVQAQLKSGDGNTASARNISICLWGRVK